jgi:hypothetical protein
LSKFLATDSGLVDYSVCVADSVTAENRARARGFVPSKAIEMKSALADGAEWGVRLFTVGRGAPSGDDALPFIVQDLGTRENRVPAFRAHPNGVSRILALHIEAADPVSSRKDIADLTGAPDLGQQLLLAFHPPTTPPRASGRGGPYCIELIGPGAKPAEFALENAHIAIRAG